MARVVVHKNSLPYRRIAVSFLVVVALVIACIGFGSTFPVAARTSALSAKSLDVSADPLDPTSRVLTVRIEGEPGSKVKLGKETILRQELGYIEAVQENRTLVGAAPDINNDISVTFENKSLSGSPDEIVINGHGKSFVAGEEIKVFFTVDEETPVGIYSVKQPTPGADDAGQPGAGDVTDPAEGTPPGEVPMDVPDAPKAPGEPGDPDADNPDADGSDDADKDNPEADGEDKDKDDANKDDKEKDPTTASDKDSDKENADAETAKSPSERRLRTARDLSRASTLAAGDQHGDFTATIDTWSANNNKPLLHDEWDRTMEATFTSRGVLRALEFSGSENFTQNSSLWSVTLNGQSIPFRLQNISVVGDRKHPRLQLSREVTVKPGDVIKVRYRQDRENGWRGNDVAFVGTANPINPPQPPLPQPTCAEGDKVWVAYSPDATNNRNNTVLAQAPWNTREFVNIATTAGPDGVGWVYNALAYSTGDGWIYAVSQDVRTDGKLDSRFPPGHLLQINPNTGEIFDRGELEGFVSSGDRMKINTGFFGNGGIYYIANSSGGGSGTLYSVNMTTLQLTKVNTPMGWSNRVSANDHAALTEYPQYAWGLPSNLSGGTTSEIERIDLNTGLIDRFNISDLGLPATIWGTAWRHSDGSISFGANDGSGSYRIGITNANTSSPQFELRSQSRIPSAANNDGTSSGNYVLDADLEIQKEFMGFNDEGRAEWKITVTNHGPCGNSGSTITDTFPSGYSEVRYNDPLVMEETTVDAENHTMTTNIAGLAPNESRDYVVSAKVGADTQCMDNAASILGIERDPVSENNNASVSRCLVNVIKKPGEAKPVEGENPNTYAVIYTVEVLNDSEHEATYGPLVDKPGFASQAKVLSATVSKQGTELKPVELAEDSSFEIAPAESKLNPGEHASYRVEITYRLETLDFDPKARECTGERGNGLFNEVTLPSGQEVVTSDNSTCVPIPVPDFPTLRVNKVDGAGNNGPLTGSAFALYEGTVAEIGDRSPYAQLEGDNQSSFDLQDLPFGQYVLVETKAPHNYFLLPKAVGFTLAPGENGPQVVLSDDSDGALVSVASDANDNVAIISVADLLAAELPYTGGRGFYVPIGIGFLVLVVGVACAYVRRNQVCTRR